MSDGGWAELYDALALLADDPQSREALGAVPVPLADGRVVRGARGYGRARRRPRGPAGRADPGDAGPLGAARGRPGGGAPGARAAGRAGPGRGRPARAGRRCARRCSSSPTTRRDRRRRRHGPRAGRRRWTAPTLPQRGAAVARAPAAARRGRRAHPRGQPRPARLGRGDAARRPGAVDGVRRGGRPLGRADAHRGRASAPTWCWCTSPTSWRTRPRCGTARPTPRRWPRSRSTAGTTTSRTWRTGSAPARTWGRPSRSRTSTRSTRTRGRRCSRGSRASRPCAARSSTRSAGSRRRSPRRTRRGGCASGADLGLGRPFAVGDELRALLPAAPDVVADLDATVQRALGGVGDARRARRRRLDAAARRRGARSGSPVDPALATAVWQSMAPDEPPERLPALVGPGRVAVVHAEDAAVADQPDVAPAHRRGRPGARHGGHGRAPRPAVRRRPRRRARGEGGEVDDVPAGVRALLPDAPSTWVQHDDLLVDGTPVDWWVEDSVVHAVHLVGLAAGLAQAAGRWDLRYAVEALLTAPDRADEIALDVVGRRVATVRSVRNPIASRGCIRSPPSRARRPQPPGPAGSSRDRGGAGRAGSSLVAAARSPWWRVPIALSPTVASRSRPRARDPSAAEQATPRRRPRRHGRRSGPPAPAPRRRRPARPPPSTPGTARRWSTRSSPAPTRSARPRACPP